MQSWYKQTKYFVTNACSNNKHDLFHAKRTVYWIKKLNPNAHEALLIAGLTHDIERAFYGDWKKGSHNNKKLQKHQKQSAKMVGDFLKKQKADHKLISQVENLVLHHEKGGTKEQNILCDADVLAYFEEKAVRLAKTYKQRGKTKRQVMLKLHHEYQRLKSTNAKHIAKKFYLKAMMLLK